MVGGLIAVVVGGAGLGAYALYGGGAAGDPQSTSASADQKARQIPSGPLSATEVTATASDASGNTAKCTFRVTVNNVPPGDFLVSCDCGSTSGAPLVGALLLLVGVLPRAAARRARVRRP